MNQDNNFERLVGAGRDPNPNEIQEVDMPSPEDLGDLFNFEFNKPNSYKNYSNPGEVSADGYNSKQSIYLFITKFESIDGLISKLKSSKNGLKDDEADLEWRQARYGKNIFDHR